ncbi:unnamed protein product [Symbiodinium pilosum]|uniref:Lipid-binding serum glycoprotein N-terminal domain-containing protein n=1 Tax=Symbiodinium pilosum TaxID=2952 RepID=A0A812IUK2_SYMPI|nr:unnamed protein product [Symbiodinium pilosum]
MRSWMRFWTLVAMCVFAWGSTSLDTTALRLPGRQWASAWILMARMVFGINMTARNAHLEYLNSTWFLSFNFHADVVGTVLKWNVEKITADGCKIEILGIEIASVCGYVERHVKDKLQTLLDSVERIDAPKILQKLQDKINTAIGSIVRIPLKLIGHAELAEAVVI